MFIFLNMGNNENLKTNTVFFLAYAVQDDDGDGRRWALNGDVARGGDGLADVGGQIRVCAHLIAVTKIHIFV
jgi:hypothetical protein